MTRYQIEIEYAKPDLNGQKVHTLDFESLNEVVLWALDHALHYDANRVTFRQNIGYIAQLPRFGNDITKIRTKENTK